VTIAAPSRPAGVRIDELERFSENGSFDLPPLARFRFCDACGNWHWRLLREPVGVQVTEDEAAWLAATVEPIEGRRRSLVARQRVSEDVSGADERPKSLRRIRRKLAEDASPLAAALALIADGDVFGLSEQQQFELAQRSGTRNLFRRPYLRQRIAEHRPMIAAGRASLLERGSTKDSKGLTREEVERRLAGLRPDEWARTVAVLVGCLLFQHPERLRPEWDGSYPDYPPEYRPRPVKSKQTSWDVYLVRLLSIVRNEYLDVFAPGVSRFRAEDRRSAGLLRATHLLSEFDPDPEDGCSEMGHDGDDLGEGDRLELVSVDDLDAVLEERGPLIPGASPEVERLLWLLTHTNMTREEASEALGKSRSWAGVVLKRLRDSDNRRVKELRWRLIGDKTRAPIRFTRSGEELPPNTEFNDEGLPPRIHLGFWGIPPGSVKHSTRLLRGAFLFPGLKTPTVEQPKTWRYFWRFCPSCGYVTGRHPSLAVADAEFDLEHPCNETRPFRGLIGVGEQRYRRRWWSQGHGRPYDYAHISVSEALTRTSIALITRSLGRPLLDGHPSNVAFVIDFKRALRGQSAPESLSLPTPNP
jgi:hypothetical protein